MEKALKSVLFLVCVLLLWPMTAYADVGPKPSISIYVENPPQEEYYLDLVIEKDERANQDNLYRQEYDEELVEIMKAGTPADSQLALIDGTVIPLFGQLTAKQDKDGKPYHKFDYVGTPDKYRILIGTASGEHYLSEWHERRVFNEQVVFDTETEEITVEFMGKAYVKQFGLTFILTIIIEGLVLLFMGYRLRENFGYFIKINLLTQVLLTLIVGYVLLVYGSMAAFIILIPVELAILIIETLYYRPRLVGHTERRNTVYGILANITSYLLGIWLIGQVF